MQNTIKNITAIITTATKSNVTAKNITDKDITAYIADVKDTAKIKANLVHYPIIAISGYKLDKQQITVSMVNLVAIYNQSLIKDTSKQVSTIKMTQAINLLGMAVTVTGVKPAITKDYIKTCNQIYVKHALKSMAWINYANDKLAANAFYYALSLVALSYTLKIDIKVLKADMTKQIAVMRKAGQKGLIDIVQKAIA